MIPKKLEKDGGNGVRDIASFADKREKCVTDSNKKLHNIFISLYLIIIKHI